MDINILDILEILDTVFKEITKKVTKIDMHNIDLVNFDNKISNSLIITTFGDYKITLVFSAGISVMRGITENMKRGKIFDTTEIELYTKEYFNILCGRVITIVNNTTHKSARFTVPNIVEGIYLHNVTHENSTIKELYYSSNYGPVKVQAIY